MIAARLVLAALAVATLAGVPADARRKHDRYNDWEDRWENRRDARRAGIVAGAIAGGIASSAAHERAENRFEECIMYNGYDYACERRRYEEEMDARRAGRRSAIIVGGITRELVRD